MLAATTISRTKVCLSDHETKDSIIRSSPLRYEKIGHGKTGKLTLTLVTLKRELDWFGFTIAISIPLTSFTPGIYGGVRKIWEIFRLTTWNAGLPRGFFGFPKGWREAVRMSDFGPVNWIHADWNAHCAWPLRTPAPSRWGYGETESHCRKGIWEGGGFWNCRIKWVHPILPFSLRKKYKRNLGEKNNEHVCFSWFARIWPYPQVLFDA